MKKAVFSIFIMLLALVLIFASCGHEADNNTAATDSDNDSTPTDKDNHTNPTNGLDHASPTARAAIPDDGAQPPVPFAWPIDAEMLDDGSVLVLYTIDPDPREMDHLLVWYDADLNMIWSYPGMLKFPHTIGRKGMKLVITDSQNERLVLIDLETKQDTIIELTNGDDQVWPNDADFDADGNIFYSDLNSGSVFLITPTGTPLWSKNLTIAGPDGELHDADELPGGHFLYCMSKTSKVVEADENGNEIWQFGNGVLVRPRSVQRLSSGNTLIADLEKVVEVTPDGTVVWDFTLPESGGMNAVRLADGNTLIGSMRVMLVAPDKTVIWELPNPSFSDPSAQGDPRTKKLREIGYL